jgi:hypothetical protein
MKPFSTYPEDRAKLLELAGEVCDFGADSERGQAAAGTLADLVRAILEDEAVAIDSTEAQS